MEKLEISKIFKGSENSYDPFQKKRRNSEIIQNSRYLSEIPTNFSSVKIRSNSNIKNIGFEESEIFSSKKRNEIQESTELNNKKTPNIQLLEPKKLVKK